MNAQTVTLIIGLVQALAWPLTLLTVIFSFRAPIGELLARLRSVEHGDTKVNFQAELQAISAKADVTTQAVAAPARREASDALEPVRTLAETAPRQAVLHAWNQLMDTFIDLAGEQRMQLTDLELKTPKHLAEHLRAVGRIDAQTCDAFVSMRLLRNKVAHAESMRVTTKDALAFVDMVAAIIKTVAGPTK